MNKTILALCCATGLFAAAAPPAAAVSSGPPSGTVDVAVTAVVQPDQTLVTFTLTETTANKDAAASWHRLVALPPNTTRYEVDLQAGEAALIEHHLMRLRGLPVISLVVEATGGEALQIAVHHDGQWDSKTGSASRLASRGFAAALGGTVLGLEPDGSALGNGSYVIITTPEYASAAAVLADWKQRKGLPVVVASTDIIGRANTAIKAYLQDGYDTWENPPEYVVLLGDIDDIPTWSISQNPTDLIYTLLDGDDWLPDAMLGRLCVENLYQAETVVNKTIGYERNPYQGIPDWFNKSLIVGANYGGRTQVGTVRFCGKQLESLGFAPAYEVMYDPFDPMTPNIWNGVVPITNYLEAGVSMVMYRGWAYGTAGWEPPHFTVLDIPQVDNGAMTPLVLSYVCLNTNYANDTPCMGEVFLRQGSPSEPKGAVAFYGNGEHWSHTRHNDAMAISMFEKVTDPAITDLGSWIMAGKLRFIDYFPRELEAEEFDELSVEFYFHIYNLLGDPELNFWKAQPTTLTVNHAASVPPGANLLSVQVFEADGITPLNGARVGVVQTGRLLGCALADPTGLARIPLSPTPEAAAVLEVTVIHPDRLPYEGTIATGDGSGAYLVTSSTTIDDDAAAPSSGNGDGLLNPGESVEVTVTLSNRGSTMATAVSATLEVTGPATVSQGSASFPDAPAGWDAMATAPFVLQIDPTAADGTRILGLVHASHDGTAVDDSQFELFVSAPALMAESVTVNPDGYADPGQDVTLVLSLRNSGSSGTTGGIATLLLNTPGVGQITDAMSVFDALVPGGLVLTDNDTFGLRVDDDVAVGTGLAFTLQITTDEGYVQETTFSLLVGRVDIGAPMGPDGYGYYAYDSADIDYPDQRPLYRWNAVSPTFGGSGTAIDYAPGGGDPQDEMYVVMDLPFPFQYYGQTFNQVRVSENGFISFDTANNVHFYNWPIPSPHGNHSIVAPFWDNFHPGPEDDTRPPPDGVFHYYDSAAGSFTIEWSQVSHYRPEIDDLQTFQLILLDPAIHTTTSGDGEILFLYKQVANNDYLRTWATIGIESPSEEDGLQLSYSNIYAPTAAPVSPGLAIRITTEPPVYSPLTLATFQAQRTAAGLQLSWSPADDRPVSGWRLYRLEAGTPLLLTEQPLPAAAQGYLDTSAPTGQEILYLVKALHPFGCETEMGPYAAENGLIGLRNLALHPCWPNPVLESTSIGFAVPRAGPVFLRIYDVAGRLVRTLVDENLPQGERLLIWDGRDDTGRVSAGGVYFYRLEAGDDVRTRKLLLVR